MVCTLASRLNLLMLTYSQRKHKNKNMKQIGLDGSEASMVGLLSQEAARLLGHKRAKPLSFSEFSVGRGIADLYIVEEDRSALRRRKGLDVPAITDKTQNQIIELIGRADGVPFEDLAKYLSRHKIANADHHLTMLFEQGIVYSDTLRVYAKEIARSNVIRHSVAIEAKVRDWRKGIKQALRYKHFADKSYLALYEAHVRSARDSLHVFETLNIGLIGVSDTGINVYYEPATNDKDPIKCLLASERVYSLIDDSQDGFVARNGFAANATTQMANL